MQYINAPDQSHFRDFINSSGHDPGIHEYNAVAFVTSRSSPGLMCSVATLSPCSNADASHPVLIRRPDVRVSPVVAKATRLEPYQTMCYHDGADPS